MKIIYVEDNPYKVADVRKVLEELGYNRTDIIIKDNLQEGLFYIKEVLHANESIPFILTDMRFPIIAGEGIDNNAGEKLIKRVKHYKKNIPIIVISADRLVIEEAAACICYNPSVLWENDLKDAIRKLNMQ